MQQVSNELLVIALLVGAIGRDAVFRIFKLWPSSKKALPLPATILDEIRRIDETLKLMRQELKSDIATERSARHVLQKTLVEYVERTSMAIGELRGGAIATYGDFVGEIRKRLGSGFEPDAAADSERPSSSGMIAAPRRDSKRIKAKG